jgi:hypothetical protein
MVLAIIALAALVIAIDIIGKFLSSRIYSRVPILNEASDGSYGAHRRFPSPYLQILYAYF